MRHKGRVRIGRWPVVVAAALATVLPATAQACRIFIQPRLEDVRFADVVVVGRITNYRIVRDEEFRRRMLASPDLSAASRRIYEDPRAGLMSDYARFDIQVQEVLVGRASRTLSVTWDNSTFAEPDHMAGGPYLIALRRPGSASAPPRGPSGTIFAPADRQSLTLLQSACSSAFIYEAASEQAGMLRRIINRQSR